MFVRCAFLGLALLAAAALAPPDAAADAPAPACETLETLHVTDAFARASAGRSRTAAAYFTVHNRSDTADRLVGAAADVAKRAELHTHIHEDGVMKMRPAGDIPVPGSGMAALKPGGDHVMVMGLEAPLVEGGRIALTLVFDQAGACLLEIPVGAVGAAGPKAKTRR